MSLDNFQISSFVAGELYRDLLVDLDSKQPQSITPNAEVPVFLGNNKKHIVVVVNDKNYRHLADDDLKFLVDILTACKLSMDDIALLNLDKNPGMHYKRILEHFTPVVILCFGIQLGSLEFPLEFPEYQVQQYNNQSYLSAPLLSKLASDKKEKMQLWNCLKHIFSI